VADLPPVPAPTERLEFRHWLDGDASVVLDLYSRPEVYRFLGSEPLPMADRQEARARIQRWKERCVGVAGVWAVQRRDHPEPPIGTVLLGALPRTDGAPSDVIEIGWHLHPDAWGHGFATEAAVALLDRARAAGLHEVRAVVYPENEPSREVCRRLGMVESGTTDEWYSVTLVEYRLDLRAADSPDVLAARIAAARSMRMVLPARLDHGLTPEGAYRAQDRVLAQRLSEGGGRGGWKLGYTSQVMREQMGVHEPNFGPLARGMLLDDGAEVSDGVTQPRVEPEIAAVLGSDVPPDGSADDVRAAVAEWRLALEVVDSVWQDYRFDWALNTADGSSAAFVVLGDRVEVDDLRAVEVVLERNGDVVGRGSASAAMGDPVEALVWLVGRLSASGDRLRAGDVVITGGLAAAVPFEPGDVVGARVAGRDDVHVGATRGLSPRASLIQQ